MIDSPTSDLSVREARQRQHSGALSLDVREPYEFISGHAPGALNVPLGQLMTQPTAFDPAQAELVLPAGAGVAFDHTPAFHLEDLVEDDSLVVRPIHTAGHTPEHVSYLVFVLASQRHCSPAAASWSAPLDDPTCSELSAGRSTSTIGLEKQTNPLLQHRTPEAFAQARLAGLQPYPKYYAFMGGINTLGPEPLPEFQVPELTAEDMHIRLGEVHVVDARPRAAFAAGHIAGSLGVELAQDFGTWVGWLVPFNAPIVLVLDSDQDLAEAVAQLERIGFDRVQGVASHRRTHSAVGEGEPPHRGGIVLAASPLRHQRRSPG